MQKKLIEGHPSYVVYESGEIRNIRTGKGIEPQIKNGYAVFYPHVPNRPDGSRRKKMLLIHRVVAAAFLPEEPGKDRVGHLDGDNFNNRVENLYWKAAPKAKAKKQVTVIEEETVKPVVGYPNYTVSVEGVVYDLKRKRNATTFLKKGYKFCYIDSLNSGRNTNKYPIHMLVAKAFLVPVEGNKFIKHKDGNILNNALSNLEWCRRSEVFPPVKGVNHYFAKLDEDAIRKIKTRLLTGENQRFIASDFGVTRANISNINRGHIWKHIQPNISAS
jgi:hypothetical protein